MTYRGDTSASNGFHLPELVKKKKKKKRRKDSLNGQGDDEPVEAAPCSPPSSKHSSIFSWCVEHTEATGSCRKKPKKIKGEKEITGSQSNATGITPDSELNSKAGTDTCVHEKKKRKRQPSEQEGGRDFCIRETPEKASNLPHVVPLTQRLGLSMQEKKQMAESDETEEFCSPIARKKKKRKKAETLEGTSSQLEASDLENEGYVSESTPVQKKKAKAILLTEQAEANRASDRLKDSRAHPQSSHKHNKTDCSDTEDTQKDLFAPSPPPVPLTQHSDLSQEEGKEAAELDKTAEFRSPIAQKKKKHKKAVTPEKASSLLEANDLENSSLHKDSNTYCSDTEGMEKDFFTPLPSPVPLTQRLDLSEEEDSVANELDRTVKFSSPAARKKSRKRKNAPSTNDSDRAEVDLAMEETAKSVAKPEQPQRPGSPLQLPTSEGDDGPQKSPTRVCSDAEKSSSSTFTLVDNEFAELSQLAVEDLDSVTKELEEFIPHVRTLSDSSVKRLAGRDLVRFRNFKKKGIAVRFGKFTKKENYQLQQNVEAFLKDTGIESAEKLFFAHRFPQEKVSIRKLKTTNLFCAKIAQGIARPWRLVYYRARKMYDPRNYSGRYSEVEKQQLKKYQTMYGNNWKMISDLMSRSSHSVETKFSEIKSEYNYGPWNCDETRKLIQAVKEVLLPKMSDLDSTLENEDVDGAIRLVCKNLCKGIPWSEVEAKVGTRHWRQCKQKWISFVSKKIMGRQPKGNRLKHLQMNIAIIERLYELDADNVEEVDWEEVSSAIGNVTPYYVRSRFYKIKANRVPHWNKRDFTEIIYHLHEVTLPVLKKQQSELLARTVGTQQAEDHHRKRVFKFSDIFHDSDYISDDDLDDNQKN